jgi:hypothetical protein
VCLAKKNKNKYKYFSGNLNVCLVKAFNRSTIYFLSGAHHCGKYDSTKRVMIGQCVKWLAAIWLHEVGNFIIRNTENVWCLLFILAYATRREREKEFGLQNAHWNPSASAHTESLAYVTLLQLQQATRAVLSTFYLSKFTILSRSFEWIRLGFPTGRLDVESLRHSVTESLDYWRLESFSYVIRSW